VPAGELATEGVGGRGVKGGAGEWVEGMLGGEVVVLHGGWVVEWWVCVWYIYLLWYKRGLFWLSVLERCSAETCPDPRRDRHMPVDPMTYSR
jgi:hypothetical protein